MADLILFDTQMTAAEIVSETPKAISLELDTQHIGRKRTVWLPKSLVKYSDGPVQFAATIQIPTWLAKDKGFSA